MRSHYDCAHAWVESTHRADIMDWNAAIDMFANFSKNNITCSLLKKIFINNDIIC